ncbi:MAG: GHKL domain-containing protein [Calditrichaeota bacterium]|nr:GHKL domain-containing protein [Calditrichota bacterium]
MTVSTTTSDAKSPDLSWLISTYFSDPLRRIRLRKGERLMVQGGYNDRLYLVLKGVLVGCVRAPGGGQYELFRATRNKFVGVYSFFSRTFVSSATVIVERDAEVAYIDQHQPVKDPSRGSSLFEQFMPVVVMDLKYRQQRELQIAREKERALRRLIHTERLASLGQMAAGIAHELNNAVAVLERNTEWLRENLIRALREQSPEQLEYFRLGLEKGRWQSTREVRQQAEVLERAYGLSTEAAHKLAETGLSAEQLARYGKHLQVVADVVHYYWQLGATFRDMAVAAQHAAHVVKSVKYLATQETAIEPDLDVNKSIGEALILLSSPLRKVDLKLNLGELPPIAASKGELVQVWSNLIRNAVESLATDSTKRGEVVITSWATDEVVHVSVQDNGPGIPKHMLPKIFQPNYTTKEKGLEFGLGLGLTIVERIVHNYGGRVSVQSRPGRTVFTVTLPIRGGYGEAKGALHRRSA